MLRQYWKWNIKPFCKTYFRFFEDMVDPMPITPQVVCSTPLQQRCRDPAKMLNLIDEIRISLADCRIYAKKDPAMQRQFELAVQSIRCALDCQKQRVDMDTETYVNLPKTQERILLPIRVARRGLH